MTGDETDKKIQEYSGGKWTIASDSDWANGFKAGLTARDAEIAELVEALDTAVFLLNRGHDLSPADYCSMKDSVTEALEAFRRGGK